MIKNPEFVLSIGALSPPLHEQVNLPKKSLATEQKLADAITLLRIHGIVPDAQARKAEQKIVQRVHTKYLIAKNPAPKTPRKRTANARTSTAI